MGLDADLTPVVTIWKKFQYLDVCIVLESIFDRSPEYTAGEMTYIDIQRIAHLDKIAFFYTITG